MIKNILELIQKKRIDEAAGLSVIKKIKKHTTGTHTGEEAGFAYGDPYLEGHQVFGEQVLLGVTHISLALNAFTGIYGKGLPVTMEKVMFVDPVILQEGGQARISPEFTPSGDALKFSIKADVQGHHAEACNGQIKIAGNTGETEKVNIRSLRDQAEKTTEGKSIYAGLQCIAYTADMQTLRQVHIGKAYTLARLQVSNTVQQTTPAFELHPALLDGAILSVLSQLIDGDASETFIPLFVKKLSLYAPVGPMTWCLGRIDKVTDELLTCSFTLLDEDGSVTASIEGISCKKVADVSTLLKDAKGKPEPAKPTPAPVATNTKPAARQSSKNNLNTVDLIEHINSYIVRKLSSYLEEGAPLDMEKNYMDLGLESSMLIQIANEIESDIGIELYPTLFFEYQCVKELGEYFLQEFPEAFAAYLNVGAAPDQAEEGQEIAQTITREAPAPEAARPTIPDPVRVNGQAPKATESKDIAIIGMGGVFPGAKNTEEFWEQLHQQADLIREIPEDHFDFKPWFDPEGGKPNTMYSKWGSFIDDVDKFDAEFFNMVSREAELTDPQLRHLLQVLYTTIDDAGYMNSIKGSDTGMYVGACFHDYQTQMVSENKTVEPYDGIGNSPTMLSNRPSFFFDLKGPSFTVDTACSSSLVALHLACKALQNGECTMAFAAGVNLLLTPGHYLYFCNIQALSRSGRSHTFDSRADGYIPGEGIASVLLKPLDKALEDGDQIHGVIKGSAIRHSGYTSTITAPNVQGEVDVITTAWKEADVDPSTISYIEAHGTGTKLGDPIEVQAIQKALHGHAKEPGSVAIGSAKAHIGHLEGAAGIAGVIKVLVSMKNRTIPAMPKFEELNPYIKLTDKDPVYINREPVEWKVNGHPRRAGVNSFGFGGTFAHVLLEEAPQRKRSNATAGQQLILLSAKKESDLKNAAANLQAYLHKRSAESYDNSLLADIAYTLQVGRLHYRSRVGFLVSTIEELQRKLEAFINGEDEKGNYVYGDTETYRDITKVFDSDADLKSSFSHYTKGKYSLKSILDLWTKGFAFDWEGFHGTGDARVISLPSYPFNTKSYWYKKRDLSRTDVKKLLDAIDNKEKEQPATHLEDFREGFASLEQLCADTLMYRLGTMKFFDKLKKGASATELQQALQIDDKYHRFLQQALNIATQSGYLSLEDGNYILEKKPGIKKNDLAARFRAFEKSFPRLKAFSTLVNTMLGELSPILTGKKLAPEVLFHPDNIPVLEEVYNSNEVAIFFNDKIGDFISAFVQENKGKEITILEIGAGVGGTTARVLPKIGAEADKLSYIYSDISPTFRSFAAKFAADYPFVNFKVVNVEKAPAAQGQEDIKADIVLASNVLHATGNLTNTLKNVRAFMKPQGTLLVNEVTAYQHFLTVTFGLVDGWWLFDDEQHRIPGSPLLEVSTWHHLMAEAGFEWSRAMHQTFEGQHVLVAQNQQQAVPAQLPAATAKKAENGAAEKEIPAGQPAKKEGASTDIAGKITAIVAEMIEVPAEDVDHGQNFMELGIDSITGVEFIQRINQEIGIRVEVSSLMNNPTVDMLSQFLAAQTGASDKGDKYDRFNVDEELYEKLKEEKQLKGKMNISKLFELEDDARITTRKALYAIYDEEDVRLERVTLASGKEMEALLCGNEGEVLVLCSPLNSLATIWQHQVPALRKKYRLIIPHYPGFGDSDMVEADFGMEEVADMLYEMLQLLKLEGPYNLAGWSMGGLIAQAFGEKYQEEAKTLTLIGTGTISMFDDNYHNEHMHVKEAIREEVINSVVQNNDVLENDHLLVATYNTTVLTHYAAKIRDFDHKAFRNIQAPVLILNGGKDKVLNPKYAKALENNFPDARYVEVDEGGHFLALTHPDRVNQLMDEFISEKQLEEVRAN